MAGRPYDREDRKGPFPPGEFPGKVRNGLEPRVSVGIIDGREKVGGRLDGGFHLAGWGKLSGPFSAGVEEGKVVLLDGAGKRLAQSPAVRLAAAEDGIFTLSGVVIGSSFHWERSEEQSFRGDLVLLARSDGTLVAINEIRIENYLASVISSEMSPEAPLEFLKAHAIMSRSWLMAAIERKGRSPADSEAPSNQGDSEICRWYEREEHDLFDVCSDDHCQRYHGITRIISRQAGEAVARTSGQVITRGEAICDARFSKCCGGLTEDFRTAWADRQIGYLSSLSDGEKIFPHADTEERARIWTGTRPEAYCNTEDRDLLRKILPDFDRETKDFFRWTVTYSRGDLEGILKEKSGVDFGSLREISPLQRGPSGRIWRLRITGSKRSLVVGKELEIRRWLSPSHLYSSAFTVETTKGSDGFPQTFIFQGAGWGHGVGLCQIGAAVMASKGFSSDEILGHYFRGTTIEKVF